MPETISRRRAFSRAFGCLAITAAGLSGCDSGHPNQRVSGTLVTPLDSIEKAEEEAAKKRDALAPRKGRRKGTK